MTCLGQVPPCFRTLKNKLFYWIKIKYGYKHPTCGISGLREHCPEAGFAPLLTAAETSNVHSVPEKQQKSSSTLILQNHIFFIAFLLKETLVLGSLKLHDVLTENLSSNMSFTILITPLFHFADTCKRADYPFFTSIFIIFFQGFTKNTDSNAGRFPKMVMLMLFRVYKQISQVSNSAGEVFCLISEKCTNSISPVQKK